MKKLATIFIAILIGLAGYSQTGSVNNIVVDQRTDGSGKVDITFNLSAEGTDYFIKLAVSFDGGVNFSTILSPYYEGDKGPIQPGSGKHIVWDGLQSHPNKYSTQTVIKLTAYSGFSSDNGTPCPSQPTVEYGGKTYNTVQIGDQCWMKENLNVGIINSQSVSQTNNGIIDKACYGDDEMNCELYGGLYQWNEAMQYIETIGAQGICPPGWHIPSDNDWKILEGTVDSQYGVGSGEWNVEGYRGLDAGRKLKSSKIWDGTDAVGFNIHEMGAESNFWTSNRYDASRAIMRRFIYNNNQIYRNGYILRQSYYHIRCIKD